jgi:hypothetical protein
MHKHVIVP